MMGLEGSSPPIPLVRSDPHQPDLPRFPTAVPVHAAALSDLDDCRGLAVAVRDGHIPTFKLRIQIRALA